MTSAHIVPPRMKRHPSLAAPDEKCCTRCKRNGEGFCVMREGAELENCADEVQEVELEEKIDELLEGK